MKSTLMKKLVPLFAVAAVLTAIPNLSRAESGDKTGGGGEPKEIDVDAIRGDIEAWITAGGARDLKLPQGVSNAEYERSMISVLIPHSVVIGFVDEDSATDPELSVTVDGQEKTCRGFISKRDALAHMLCHRGRYKDASESERYQLIHHEYAGLAGVEKNIGASSDYSVSTQITAYLVPVTVLRLAVKGVVKAREVDTSCRISIGNLALKYNGDQIGTARKVKALITLLEKKGYEITGKRKAAIQANGGYMASFSGDVSTFAKLYLTHKDTGFSLEMFGMGHGVIPDPRRKKFATQLKSAHTVSEYQAAQEEIDAMVFNDLPAQSAFEAMKIPTCEKFYGKRALTLTE